MFSATQGMARGRLWSSIATTGVPVACTAWASSR